MPAPLFYTDQLFEKAALPHKVHTESVFESCVFKSCNFADLHFSGCTFVDCTFDICNLSLANFSNAGLQNINFKSCKLTGVDFSKSKDFLFAVNFTDCLMDYTSFYKKKNKKAVYQNCSIKNADFSEADLSSVNFQYCDLQAAIFDGTVLNGANLVTSFNYVIDPEKNRVKKARFSVHGLAGLLANHGIIVEGIV